MNREAFSIVVFFAIAVALAAVYLIAKVVTTRNRLDTRSDFFTAKMDDLDLYLKRKNAPIHAKEYVAIMAVSSIGFSAFCFYATKSAFVSLCAGLAGLMTPQLVLAISAKKQKQKFEEEFMQALEQMSTSLRAGMSIAQAVDDVVHCPFVGISMRKRFQSISSDLKVGVSVSEAFTRFARETDSVDANDVAIALTVQNEIGGHEADVVRQIADNIHTRINIRKEIKSSASGTSTMVTMLDIMPFAVLIFLFGTNSSYIQVYFSSPVGLIILTAIIGLFIMGIIVNHRMLDKMKGV